MALDSTDQRSETFFEYVMHYRCGDCEDADIWGSRERKLQLLRGWKAYEYETRMRMQERIVLFLKARRLTGDLEQMSGSWYLSSRGKGGRMW